ncbi:MAG: Holliday junction resolvase RuvX [Bacteroidia bacterium]|nr:Holliday junction resolvase RuvX [Bacteroidia bacterium]MCC6768757.1 Holliday junction resolvase RuvX [Bacteroidia bacterium]
MARILAIDFGTKRTGIAVSDRGRMIATPLETIEGQYLHSWLENYFTKEPVDTIVVGEPKRMNGQASGPAEALENFVRFITKKYPDKKIVRQDERFTSLIAKQTLITAGASKKQRQDKKKLDTISAVIILQDYMSANPG